MYYFLRITQATLQRQLRGISPAIQQIPYFFLNQLGDNLKSICNLKENPRLIKTSYSWTKTGGLLLQYNQILLLPKQYLDSCYNVIMRKHEIPQRFSILVVYRAHLIQIVKFFVEKPKWYHRNKNIKALTQKFKGRLNVSLCLFRSLG